jgi:hypothetical protein
MNTEAQKLKSVEMLRWNAFPSLFLALRLLLARDIQKYPFTGADSGLGQADWQLV